MDQSAKSQDRKQTNAPTPVESAMVADGAVEVLFQNQVKDVAALEACPCQPKTRRQSAADGSLAYIMMGQTVARGGQHSLRLALGEPTVGEAPVCEASRPVPSLLEDLGAFWDAHTEKG